MLPALKVKTTLPIIDVKGDTIIFREGGEDRRMFLVLEGSVKIYNEHDEKETEVATIRKYEFFGEAEMYIAKPRTANAKTLSDTKLVIIRSPRELERFATNNPWLSGKMMGTMGKRLAVTNELLARKIISETPATGTGVESVTNINSTDNVIRRIVRH
jgi:CRP-like cAMP-binding protein